MARLFRTGRDPYQVYFRAVQKLRPRLLWDRINTLSLHKGIQGVFLLFSFDCDTAEDAGVVLEVDSKMRSLGLCPAYAVPGELLMRHQSIYQVLRDQGAEFLNHGFLQHTRWDSSKTRYESTYFYDTLSAAEIIQDVTEGHRVLSQFLGKNPSGFRTPHFGTYQSPKQLQFLHRELLRLNYRYSSSTTPYFACRYGYPLKLDGITEIPVSGSFTNPVRVMDSWSFYAQPNRRFTGEDYLEEAHRIAQHISTSNWNGVLNFYADPSHIARDNGFYEAIRCLREVATTCSFDGLVQCT